MKQASFLKAAVLVAGIATVAAGCVTRERVVYTQPPPVVAAPGGEVVVSGPPPSQGVVESVTIAPDPTYLWIAGAWAWNGGWVWEPGHWAHRPHPGAVWIAPHYVYRGGRHVWARGYWK